MAQNGYKVITGDVMWVQGCNVETKAKSFQYK